MQMMLESAPHVLFHFGMTGTSQVRGKVEGELLLATTGKGRALTLFLSSRLLSRFFSYETQR